jgi:hypothetical protein
LIEALQVERILAGVQDLAAATLEQRLVALVELSRDLSGGGSCERSQRERG